MTIRDNLERLIEEKGTNASALAKKAGLGHTAVRDIILGKSDSPRFNTIEKIAKALGVEISDLLNGTDDKENRVIGKSDFAGQGKTGHVKARGYSGEVIHGRVQTVPVIDMVEAGPFSEAPNPYPKGEGSEYVQATHPHARLFAVRVRGDSMNKEFPDGSTVIVDYTDRDLIDRKFYIVRIGSDTTFKMYRAEPQPRLEPYSYGDFDAIFPCEGEEWDVIGRVVQQVKSY